MTTATLKAARRPTPKRVVASPPPRGEPPLVDVVAEEIRARRALAEALMRMQAAHASAVRDLEQLDAFLREVRKRLRVGGYLGAEDPAGVRVSRREKTTSTLRPS